MRIETKRALRRVSFATTIARMKSAPNKTRLTGRLLRFEPAADGHGGEIEIEVIRNDSPDPAADFLRPLAGGRLRAFFPEPDPGVLASLIGRAVRIELTFLGGPSGGRAVVQDLRAE